MSYIKCSEDINSLLIHNDELIRLNDANVILRYDFIYNVEIGGYGELRIYCKYTTYSLVVKNLRDDAFVKILNILATEDFIGKVIYYHKYIDGKYCFYDIQYRLIFSVNFGTNIEKLNYMPHLWDGIFLIESNVTLSSDYIKKYYSIKDSILTSDKYGKVKRSYIKKCPHLIIYSYSKYNAKVIPLNDDYYLLSCSSDIYLCDQLSGVDELLSNLEIMISDNNDPINRPNSKQRNIFMRIFKRIFKKCSY